MHPTDDPLVKLHGLIANASQVVVSRPAGIGKLDVTVWERTHDPAPWQSHLANQDVDACLQVADDLPLCDLSAWDPEIRAEYKALQASAGVPATLQVNDPVNTYPTEQELKSKLDVALQGKTWVSLGKWSVPSAPFRAWARKLAQPEGLRELPDSEWTAISPPGWKMANDIPEHTDWLIAAGLLETWQRLAGDPERDDLHSQAYVLAGKLQQGKAVGHTVLVPGAVNDIAYTPKTHKDHVVKGAVLVLPNLSMDWYAHAVQAAAVLTETGGALAHLATELRGSSIPIYRVEGARTLYPTGTKVLLP